MSITILMILIGSFTLQIIHMIKQDQKFGKFRLKIDKFKACKGPKRNDCCNITFSLINETAVNYNLVLTRPVVLTKGKVTARTNGSDFLRLQMKKPCEHLFMKQLLHTTLNASQNCVINPGYYRMVIDIDKISQTYYGGTFLYGHFAFKSLFMTDDCNLSCTDVEVTFTPRNT